MGWTTQTGNYVKFLRGTPQAWEAQTNPNPDTLYFICEAGANVETGRLYLGNKLIADGTTNSISTLSDLEDVLIQSGVNIANNSLLIYDNNLHKWKPVGLNSIFQSLMHNFVGATAAADGDSGLVPAPQAGDNTKYLRGDGSWANPTEALQTMVNTLVGSDSSKSVRTIAAEETAKIVNNAPEAFDTLKEIADWISANRDAQDIVLLDNRVDALEDLINGTFDENDQRLTNGVVLDLQNLTGNYTTLSTKVTQIEQTIKWQDMVYETEEG